MSDIPQARKRLKALIKQIGALSAQLEAVAEEAAEIEGLMYKRFTKPRAPVQSVPMSPELHAALRAFAQNNPHMSSQQIGDIFQVNPGRVSEALQREVLS
jgi:hypothetical protein